jgi:hypothetical protein
MHPADAYLLGDPQDFWKQGRLFSRTYMDLGDAAVSTLNASTRAHLAFSFLTTLKPKPPISTVVNQSGGGDRPPWAGSTVVGGRSRARVFYQARPLSDQSSAWVYTYNLFYP